MYKGSMILLVFGISWTRLYRRNDSMDNGISNGYVISRGLQIAAGVLVSLVIRYVAYIRYFYHLVIYPEPFTTSLTNLCTTYHMCQGHGEYVVHHLNDKCSAIVESV